MMKIWTTLLNGGIGMRGTPCLPALIVLVAALVLAAGCEPQATDVPAPVDAPVQAPSLTNAPLNASVAKWFDNHAAAISITNDDWPIRGREPDIDSYVMEHGLVMGYEISTGNSFYGDRQTRVVRMVRLGRVPQRRSIHRGA